MKNKFLAVILIIILFIPTVLAFISYNPPFDKLTDNKDMITSAVIETSNGVTNEYTDKETISAVSALLSGEKTAQIPDEANSFNSFKIKLKGGDVEEVYTVYMNVGKLEDIYYYNEDDRVPYRSSAEDGRNFAALDASKFLYGYDVPTLTVGENKTVISPMEFTWRYKNVKGDYVEADIPVTDEVVNVGTLNAGDLDILFSRVPEDTDVYITITDSDGNEVKRPFNEYNGVYPQTETSYTFKIEVQWRETEGMSGVGNGKYSFAATVKAAPTFNVWTTNLEHTGQLFVERGGVIVVGAKNIDPSRATFKSEPVLCEGVKFYKDGDASFAVIPTTYATEPGVYSMTFEYGAIKSTYEVTVTEKNYSSKDFDVKRSVLEEYMTEENLKAVKTLIESITSSEPSSAWLGGDEFLFPTHQQDYVVGYGNSVEFAGEETEHVHIGIQSRLYKGDFATAMASGKVAFVGEDKILGGYVVIDHGLGVRSWYTRLDVSGINVGDEFEKGSNIAPNNGSGFGENSKRTFSAVSVGNNFVSPLWLIENGFSLPEV